MEKRTPVAPPSGTGLGSRPASQCGHTQPLSETRAVLLERLREQPDPSTLAALISATGLHANTVREHLDALVRQGLVRRRPAASRGRGRPAWLYEATGAHAAPRSPAYVQLAIGLAAAIHRGSSSPRAEGVAAGAEWGRELARDRGSRPGTDRPHAHRRVVDLLDDLGFAPETDEKGATVRLTCCPLLEAAHRYADVVCGVHLGIVRGALAEYGASPAGTELLAYAEPGACLLELPPAADPAAR